MNSVSARLMPRQVQKDIATTIDSDYGKIKIAPGPELTQKASTRNDYIPS